MTAGCSGSSDGAAPPATSPPSRTTPAAPSTSASAPSAPTVPADVPTTGPNLRSRGEKPPIEPVAALEHTPEGAKAFAEFFIKTIDWGFATTSSKYMRHYYEATCIECENAARGLDSAARARHHFIGDRFTIRRVETVARSGSAHGLDIYFDVTSTEVVDQAGKFVDALGALINFRERVQVTWSRGQWKVTTMIPKAATS